ncbi:hypothetical protein AB1388_29325 [Streptomyces hydrogenans]|uniref:trypsin-like serine peptidase n=1 Tax=Streptomyces hydrogenans TaxID=1873719 RepID=UPI00345D7AB3
MRSVRLIPAVLGVAAALALTATACGPTETPAAGGAGASASAPSAAAPSEGAGGADGLAGDLADKLKKHGVDLDAWKRGGWRDWDTGTWLREAEDFVNPVIEDLWDPARMQSAKSPAPTITAQAGASGSDPVPRPVTAQREKTPYHSHAAPVGKIFFDSPQGSMVCSGTIVKDPRRPGKSNLVWTAGHCVHAGQRGGWYRNITFVPAFNDLGKSPSALRNARPHEVYPYGQYWADWAVTSGEWLQRGGTNQAWPYDYAVLHVQPQRGGKSLEETVGAALPVDFSAPAPAGAGTVGGRRGAARRGGGGGGGGGGGAGGGGGGGGGVRGPRAGRPRDRGGLGLPAGGPVRRRDHAQVPGPAVPAHDGPGDAGHVPDRLHDDGGFVGRRLVPGAAGREDGAGVEHVDRPGGQPRLVGRPPARPRGQGGVRHGQREVRPLTRSSRPPTRSPRPLTTDPLVGDRRPADR